MVATAIIGSAVIGTVGTGIAASSAAGAQKDAANTASQTQRDMFNQAAGYESPFIQGGQQAYSTLNNLLGVGGNSSTMQSALEKLPGYQFTLGQGLKSVQNSAASRGLADSGAALKGAAGYATGLANSQYGNYANMLQNSANTGAQSANSLAGYATTTGGNIGANQIGAGNAQAAAYNSIGGAVTGGANNVAQYYTLNSLLNNGGGAASAGASGTAPWGD